MPILNNEDWSVLDVFRKNNASHEEEARVGEMFMLKLYNAKRLSTTLNKLRYVLYMQKMSKTSIHVHLQSLPPTCSAAKYHSYRAYFAVQEWLGNAGNLIPTDWGCEQRGGIIVSCKAACGKRLIDANVAKQDFIVHLDYVFLLYRPNLYQFMST